MTAENLHEPGDVILGILQKQFPDCALHNQLIDKTKEITGLTEGQIIDTLNDLIQRNWVVKREAVSAGQFGMSVLFTGYALRFSVQ